MTTKTSVLFLGLMLAACGGGANDGAEQDAAAVTEDTMSDEAMSGDEESFADPMHDAIDKAENVENEAMEHKQAIDEAIEEADESPADPPAGE